MNKLNEFKEAHFGELDQLMPIVERVHGKHHPEFFDVSKVYGTIREKLNGGNEDLDGEFAQLREITDNYAIPGDVCETYEKIYKVLEQFDGLYEGK
ncbi:MAG: iron-sulfur cluster repair di-iron protein, ric [Tissierellia bacterium]|nr:iron-sulfur cluster repair di-iron protein, ric [Tissierellia bacterium]